MNPVGVLISQSHQRAIRMALFAVTLLAMLALAAVTIATQVTAGLRGAADGGLAHYTELRASVISAFEMLQRDVTAPACTEQFHDQLRKVAYLPDGLNEFIYADDDKPICSTNVAHFDRPIAFGPPDVAADNPFRAALWIDRDLDFVGLAGLTGILAQQGHFVIVVPAQNPTATLPRWMSSEVILKLPDGRWWHRSGDSALYQRHLDGGGGPWPLNGDAFRHLACDPVGVHCVIVEATLGNLFAFGPLTVLAVLLVCAIGATWLSARLYDLLHRFVAFEARFLRHFDARSICCAYQPILNLRSGAIVGVEALARWQDIDGRLVDPGHFLPIVEKRNLTRELTRLVVARAAEDLKDIARPGQRLQVNINLAPRDLEETALADLFAPLLAEPQRFAVVVEIVETEAFDAAAAQRAIDSLRRQGVAVYLDDFGVGFSSIHTLAGLSVDGVKLDRAFAQAADGSLLGQMLPNALALLQWPGRVVVVEGVETEERMRMLRATGHVDEVQGYLISRPLQPAALRDFLARSDRDRATPRLVA